MDFENIYNSRFYILKMLKIRGYDVSSYENQTKEELNILYQNHNKKITYDIDTLDIHIKTNDDKSNIMVKYILVERCRAKNLEKVIDTLFEDFLDNNDVCIIITKDKVTYKGTLETYINKIFNEDKKFAQVFHIQNFLYDITEHILCPKYKILNKDETDKVLKKYNSDISSIPDIYVNDALGSIYGIRIGQMIEIEYPSQTAGIYKSYRVCKS